MRKLRILALMHEQLMPPETIDGLTDEEIAPFKTEYDIVVTLEDLGHKVRCVGVDDDLGVLRRALDEFRPHIVFNILEEFADMAEYDPHVVSYLELLRIPFTGCSPKGLTLARDKALSKRILASHAVPVPPFAVFRRRGEIRRPEGLPLPLFVKSLTEEASLGIARASIVRTDRQLERRVRYIHEKIGTDAIAEQYVEGRELYVGILGNDRLEVLPIWELLYTKADKSVPIIATERAKWNAAYQAKYGITTRRARRLPDELRSRIELICKQAYRALGVTGYARVDLRLSPGGQIYVLEVNPNPQLMYGEDFAESAHAAGIVYEELLERIIRLGLRYAARR